MARDAAIVLTGAQRLLVVENTRLAHHVARSGAGQGRHWADDLHSAALEALCQAALAWDPRRGIPFAGFAGIRIRGAVNDELRRLVFDDRCRRRKEHAVLPDEATLGSHESADAIACGLDVEEVVSLLPPPHRTLAHQWLIRGCPQRQIAAELGVTESRISQRIASLRPILRATVAVME